VRGYAIFSVRRERLRLAIIVLMIGQIISSPSMAIISPFKIGDGRRPAYSAPIETPKPKQQVSMSVASAQCRSDIYVGNRPFGSGRQRSVGQVC
jgi:hypothetical protein